MRVKFEDNHRDLLFGLWVTKAANCSKVTPTPADKDWQTTSFGRLSSCMSRNALTVSELALMAERSAPSASSADGLTSASAGEQHDVIDEINFGIKDAFKILHMRQVQRLTGVALKKFMPISSSH